MGDRVQALTKRPNRVAKSADVVPEKPDADQWIAENERPVALQSYLGWDRGTRLNGVNSC